MSDSLRPHESQTGIKIAGEVNNLRYANDTTNGRKQRGTKEPLDKVKEESEKVGLKLNVQKTKITAPSPIPSWHKDGETMETVRDFIFVLQNHCRW